MGVRIVEGDGDLGIILTRYEALVTLGELEDALEEKYNKLQLVGVLEGVRQQHMEQMRSVITKLKAKV